MFKPLTSCVKAHIIVALWFELFVKLRFALARLGIWQPLILLLELQNLSCVDGFSISETAVYELVLLSIAMKTSVSWVELLTNAVMKAPS